MKVAIGCDHGGLRLKDEIIAYLKEQNIDHFDFGTYTTDSVDYPDISRSVALAVTGGEYERGIIICGTGIGVCIAANKVRGIRAALCHDVYSAQMTREHNNSNVLTMGERVIGPGLAVAIVEKWLNTDFVGGRHERRVGKITDMEQLS